MANTTLDLTEQPVLGVFNRIRLRILIAPYRYKTVTVPITSTAQRVSGSESCISKESLCALESTVVCKLDSEDTSLKVANPGFFVSC